MGLSRFALEQPVLRMQTANKNCSDYTPGPEEPRKRLGVCLSCFVTETIHGYRLQAVSFLVFQAEDICIRSILDFRSLHQLMAVDF